jgi:hypothetical protein
MMAALEAYHSEGFGAADIASTLAHHKVTLFPCSVSGWKENVSPHSIVDLNTYRFKPTAEELKF